jgi:potassium-transporting ATPase KdpC subunit
MKTIITSIKILLFFSIILGLIYPLFVLVIGQLVFPMEVNGNIVIKNEKVIGSRLIAQKFSDDKYFWSRPSSIDYNPIPSGASNLSPTSAQLKSDYILRKKNFSEKNDLLLNIEVPPEMLFASGSGVDPHISKQAALMQLNRIVRIRNFDSNKKVKLMELIEKLSQKRVFNVLGEEIINVIDLNLQLDMI